MLSIIIPIAEPKIKPNAKLSLIIPTNSPIPAPNVEYIPTGGYILLFLMKKERNFSPFS